MTLVQNYINHVGLVIDASISMKHLEKKVIQVIDTLIKNLANSSQVHDQETRVTIYTFGWRVDCVAYDKDVLRSPSIKSFYRADQRCTALIDGTMRAIEDMNKTATLYGDHSFLIFAVTDGQENCSTRNSRDLKTMLSGLPKEWTLALLVPDNQARAEAIKWGFSPDNIDKWDTDERGVETLGTKLASVSDAYMTMRTSGQRGTSNVFNLDKKGVQAAVKAGELTKLKANEHRYFKVPTVIPQHWLNGYGKLEISTFYEQASGQPYRIGTCFYEFVKPDKIQPTKRIAVQDNKTGATYLGDAARQMLGISTTMEVRLKPNHDPNFKVFIESTSTNRVLPAGTSILEVK